MTRKAKPKAARKTKSKVAAQPTPPPERRGRGQPAYKPTEKDRATVKAMIGFGIKQDDVCAVLGISDDTLRKYFPNELTKSATEANAAVAQSMFHMATKGRNVAAAIWWEKTRRGLSDRLIVQDGGPADDLSTLTDAELAERIARLRRTAAVPRSDK